MVRTGLLRSHREGRTTSYALAGPFLAAWERVRDQGMTRPVAWPGHFHAVLHAVPEEHRAFRDQLRRAAVQAGYGVLQPGVLISLTDRRHALAEVLTAAPPEARVRPATLGLDRADAAEAAAVGLGPRRVSPPGSPTTSSGWTRCTRTPTTRSGRTSRRSSRRSPTPCANPRSSPR